MMRRFDHPNIVRYIDSYGDRRAHYLIMERCDFDLTKWTNGMLEKYEVIPEDKILLIFKEIAKGLAYIHS